MCLVSNAGQKTITPLSNVGFHQPSPTGHAIAPAHRLHARQALVGIEGSWPALGLTR